MSPDYYVVAAQLSGIYTVPVGVYYATGNGLTITINAPSIVKAKQLRCTYSTLPYYVKATQLRCSYLVPPHEMVYATQLECSGIIGYSSYVYASQLSGIYEVVESNLVRGFELRKTKSALVVDINAPYIPPSGYNPFTVEISGINDTLYLTRNIRSYTTAFKLSLFRTGKEYAINIWNVDTDKISGIFTYYATLDEQEQYI